MPSGLAAACLTLRHAWANLPRPDRRMDPHGRAAPPRRAAQVELGPTAGSLHAQGGTVASPPQGALEGQLVAHRGDSPVVARPDLFIVGAPKCGTTALYEYLRRHPSIFMSRIKEPHFFAKDLGSYPFIKTLEEY